MASGNSYRNSRRREILSELFSDIQNPENSKDKESGCIKDAAAETNSLSIEGADRPIKEEAAGKQELKKLIPGETLIGTRVGTIQGELRQLKIFYGNFINPMNIHNGKYVPFKKKEYLKILDEFLESEEGKQYQKPSEDDIRRAFDEVKTSVDRYIEDLNTKNTGMIQPGRSRQTLSLEKKEVYRKDEEGQIEESPEESRFADDLSEKERKEVELIRTKQYTRQQMEEIRKSFDSEKRNSSITMIVLVLFTILIFSAAVFLARDGILGSMATIELELKQKSVTLKAGDAFVASEYVKYVTEDSNVFIIYPSLDTGKTGEYDLDYVATNNYRSVRKTLRVKVVDSEAPSIVLAYEEIKLVRNRDEESFDPLSFIETISDNIDKDLVPVITEIDWEKDEQILIYRLQDSSGNASTASLKVMIEDKAICDRNAVYEKETNTCSCNRGYKGDGTACRLISTAGSAVSSGNSTASDPTSQSSDQAPPNPQPSSPAPSNPSPFINASSITVKIGTSIPDVQAKLVAGISSSSGYWVDFTSVNTSVPGSYPVYIHGNDGAEGSCTVTVVE